MKGTIGERAKNFCKKKDDGVKWYNGLIVEPKSRPTLTHKEKFTSDIINNVAKTAKDQRSALPMRQESKKNFVLPKALSDIPLKLELESDSDSESYTKGSDTEDDRFMPDKAEELKAVFKVVPKGSEQH